jgi:hypothetical protein
MFRLELTKLLGLAREQPRKVLSNNVGYDNGQHLTKIS